MPAGQEQHSCARRRGQQSFVDVFGIEKGIAFASYNQRRYADIADFIFDRFVEHIDRPFQSNA